MVALISLFRLNLDTDFMSFFSSGNPKAEEFDRLNEKYRIDETISVLIEHEDSLLDGENLQKIFKLQERIEALDGISKVQGFIPSEIATRDRSIPVDEKFIDRHHDILEDFIEDKYYLTDQFLSSDHSKGVLVVNLEFDAVAGEVVRSLEEIVQHEGGLALSLAGNEIIRATLWDYFRGILFILPPSAILLVLLVFSLFLKNLRFTIMAIIPAGLGALWAVGTILWSGQELNLLTVSVRFSSS